MNRPAKRKVTVKITKKPVPVRLGSGGLVAKGLPSTIKNGKRVYYG